MDIKEEVKKAVVAEVKSNYHKGRVVGAVVEKGYKVCKNQARFIGRYIKELKK